MHRTLIVELVQAALAARKQAVAPYSRFPVGAALRVRSGRIVTGSNVESASYGLTCCAERVALFTALSSGCRDITAIAVVASIPGGPLPCGACRQLLAEYAPRSTVWIADSRRPAMVRCLMTSRLLPEPFVGRGKKLIEKPTRTHKVVTRQKGRKV